jgi:hypothetical protein
MSRVVTALCAALLFACGCKSTSPQRLAGYEQYQGTGGAATYARTLRVWTKELRLYDRFETKLLMRAVFKSERFRTAWSHEYARRNILPSESYALLREREKDDAARFHEILFAAWAGDSKSGHFIGDDAPWTIRLVGDDGRTVSPLLLNRIKRPSTELLTLFPFITPHDRIFVAKFPVLADDGTPLISEQSRALTLQVAGVLARGEMIWPLRRPRDEDGS